MQIRPCIPAVQTRRALNKWRDSPASKNNCQWNNFPTPRSHSLSAFRSRVWLCQTSGVYAHVVCENVTSPGMLLIFFRCIRWAGRQKHHWYEVCVLQSFFYWAAIGSRQTCTDLLLVQAAVKTTAPKSAVDGPACRSLTCGLFSATVCGVCLQWAECKLHLKSDLKVSPRVERPLPLPFLPRLKCRWTRHHTVFVVCLKKEGNDTPLSRPSQIKTFLIMIYFL